METRGKKGKTDKKIFDEQNREDAIYILEQVWHLEPEDTFYKIFHKHSKGAFFPSFTCQKQIFSNQSGKRKMEMYHA